MAKHSGQGAQPAFAVTVLGNLEVLSGGIFVPIGHARQKAVLAVLATEASQVVSVEQLIERVWGERMPVRARSVLRTYVSRLRRSLHRTGVTITWHDTGYKLTADPDSVDVRHFHRLLAEARASDSSQRALALVDEALALWRGEPLAELDTPWTQSLRTRLRQERNAAQADRIDWALQCGRHSAVLPELTAQAARRPLDERLIGQVMLALYGCGRQTEALKHYRHIRQQLAEKSGTDPGPALQELHQRILLSDPDLISSPVRATRPVVLPRQLPSPPMPFVGRSHERHLLDTALETNDYAATVVISTLSGAGGIGKTWLALHWAHRNADRFPDGQLFVDLQGFSPGSEPLDPATGLRGFLVALGIDHDGIPTDLAARAALYRSVVAGKRMLVVLDNAATVEQVTPLLPGSPTCTVLVTSRTRLASLIDRYGAVHLQLDVLTDAEARQLLARRLGRTRITAEHESVNELIQLCGGYPLALSITARNAATRPAILLAEVAAELRELRLETLDHDTDPAASLPAVLSWSLGSLTSEQRQVFALLGLAPGPDIGLTAIGPLTGLSAAQTRNALHGLEMASLVYRGPRGRYAMHDLIRRYAADTAHATNNNDEALRRLADFYLHTAIRADQVLSSGGIPLASPLVPEGCQPLAFQNEEDASRWLDDELACLLAVADFAARARWHAIVWQIARALDTVLYRRGRFHDRLARWQAALTAAEHLQDTRLRGWAHRGVGQSSAMVGLHDESLSHLRRAFAMAEETADLALQAEAQHTLAWIWRLREDDLRAFEHATRALDLFRRAGDPLKVTHALGALGWYSTRLKRYEQARVHCDEALALTRASHDREGEANALDSLGHLAHHTGHYVQAVAYFNQALTLYRALGNAYEQADSWTRLGEAHFALDQHDEARAAWQKALVFYRRQGREEEAERTQRQLGELDRHDVSKELPSDTEASDILSPQS